MNSRDNLENLPKSAKEAREMGSRHYFTGKPCKRGHIDVRLTSTLNCLSCGRIHSKNYAKNNKEEVRSRLRKWRSENREHIKDYNSKWSAKNREQRSKYNRQYYLSHKGKIHSNNAARKALKKQATPKWMDKEEIEYIYNLASERGLEVDHIVPLNSPYVCGLHTGDNLRCIPAELNYKKGNRYWPDMPEELKERV